MRLFKSVTLIFLVGLAALGMSNVKAAPTYTSKQLPSSGNRQYIDLNNNLRALTMRQDAPGAENLHIVVENWTPGYYSEFRPGTLPGSTQSTALDFNDSLDIVGYAQSLDADGTAAAPQRAFLYTNGAFIDLSRVAPLNSPNNVGSGAISVNSRGDVLGYWDESGIGRHWFIYSQGTITDLGDFNSATMNVTPNAINSALQMTGSHSVPATPTQQASIRAFFYSQGTLTDVDAAPSGLGSKGLRINSNGEVAGTSRPSTHAQACFIYTSGAVRTFALHPGSESFCTVNGFNNAGTVVGVTTNDGSGPTHMANTVFLYSNGQNSDLNALLDPNDGLVRNQTWLQNVFAINEAGFIIAKTNTTFYLLTPNSAVRSTDAAYYHFEQTTHDWFNSGDPIVSLTSSADQHFAGAASLAVQFSGSGFASVGGMYPPPLAGKTVTFHVFLPVDADIDWVQPFMLEDYFGNWAWHGNWQPASNLQFGAWNTITVKIPPEATPGYRIGVEFFASHFYDGTVYVDSVGF